LGIAPPFTDLVLLVIVAPEVGLADYIINVMLHQMSVNIKNVRLHKKCRLAQRSAVVLVAYLVGPNRIFQRQAKQPLRPLQTLSVVQESRIRARLKMCRAPLKMRALNSLTRMVEDPAFVFVSHRARFGRNKTLTKDDDVPDPSAAPAISGVVVSSGVIREPKLTRLFAQLMPKLQK